MRLIYLVANNAWTFAFGDSLIDLTDRFGESMGYFWPSRKDAVEAAASIGLNVNRSGKVSCA